MSIVYGIRPIGKLEEQKDILECFRRNEAFKVNSGSGPFRIFIWKLEASGEGWNFKGRVSITEVEGYYCPRTQVGVLVFLQEQKVKVELRDVPSLLR